MVTSIARALEGFLVHLRDVAWLPLAGAVALHTLSSLYRAVAWRNILAAAAPGRTVCTRPIVGAYLGAAAANAVLPARIGDLLRLRVAHRRIGEIRYTTLGSTLLAETVMDVVLGVAVLAWGVEAHVIPGAALVSGSARGLAIGLLIVTTGGVAVALAVRAGVLRGLARGLAVLRTPRRYLWSVALPQLAAWALGLATTLCMLRAFHIAATPGNALRLQLAQVVATLVPTGSAAIGIRGAAAVYMLGGQASRGTLVDYAVASEIVLVTASIAVGIVGLALAADGSAQGRVATDGFAAPNIRSWLLHARRRAPAAAPIAVAPPPTV